MGKKSNYWPQGSILKDPDGRWWKVHERRSFGGVCAGFYEMECLDKKANGDVVLVNHGLDYVATCMEEVTPAEMVLYGKKHA